VHNTAVIAGIMLVAAASGSAHAAELPQVMHCAVSGHAGCNGDVCVGAGTKEPSIKLTISQTAHTLYLNGIAGSIDDGVGNPYADGKHKVRWKRDLISFASYYLSQPQPGGVYLTLRGGNNELEFRCSGTRRPK
jgi:hypothetical protein